MDFFYDGTIRSIFMLFGLLFTTNFSFLLSCYDMTSLFFLHHSIALVVDSPQFFNRLAESFVSRISARFIVLLWGDKSSLDSKGVKDIPVYDYNDIIELGQEKRNALQHSREQGIFCMT
jgi:hypothetical protein